MLRMMMPRGRKMMMLRMMTLRRRRKMMMLRRRKMMDVADDDVEEEDRWQDQDPHFARVFAIEMHLDISQEQLYAEIYRKNARAQDRGPQFVRACTVEICRNALGHFTIAILRGKSEVKTPPTSTGLYTYRKIPSVWTHCLENELQLQRHCWGLKTCREHITSFIGSSGVPTKCFASETVASCWRPVVLSSKKG